MYSCVFNSSLLIVYEGYEESSQIRKMDDDTMLEEATANNMVGSSSTTDQSDDQVKPMEEDSRSGNCSYDADASNDSIELNLSLDEQQPCIKQPYTNHMQTDNLPVREIEIVLLIFFVNRSDGNSIKIPQIFAIMTVCSFFLLIQIHGFFFSYLQAYRLHPLISNYQQRHP